MKHTFLILSLLLSGWLMAQEQTVHSVYFEFNKSNLTEKQITDVVTFVKSADSTRIESVQIYGYTDDIGKDAYNYKLSNNRANALRDKMIERGVKNRIIITIEGKGRVLIDDDIVPNLPEVRSKNRRVDVVLNVKPLPKMVISGFHTAISSDRIVGDHIYLENILFDRGCSRLTAKSKTELDRIAKLLQKYKNIEFEIQGHICCTPPFQREAIDMDTKKRELSTNRAISVFKYLVSKRIDKKRMTFKGYGNTVPLGKGADYDRRVELVITKV